MKKLLVLGGTFAATAAIAGMISYGQINADRPDIPSPAVDATAGDDGQNVAALKKEYDNSISALETCIETTVPGSTVIVSPASKDGFTVDITYRVPPPKQAAATKRKGGTPTPVAPDPSAVDKFSSCEESSGYNTAMRDYHLAYRADPKMLNNSINGLDGCLRSSDKDGWNQVTEQEDVTVENVRDLIADYMQSGDSDSQSAMMDCAEQFPAVFDATTPTR